MYTITWITPHGVETISTPRRAAAFRVFMAVVRDGKTARLWCNGEMVF